MKALLLPTYRVVGKLGATTASEIRGNMSVQQRPTVQAYFGLRWPCDTLSFATILSFALVVKNCTRGLLLVERKGVTDAGVEYLLLRVSKPIGFKRWGRR